MIVHDITQAIELLSVKIEANVTPVVTLPEIEKLLAQHVNAVLWEASTAYAYGTVVQPTAANRNGRSYKLIKFQSGVSSGATEPNWPSPSSILWAPWNMSDIADGGLLWAECGPDFDSLWDLDAAAKAGWLLKAGKVAACQDSTIEGVGSFQFSGVYDHCLRQAEKYNSVTCA